MTIVRLKTVEKTFARHTPCHVFLPHVVNTLVGTISTRADAAFGARDDKIVELNEIEARATPVSDDTWREVMFVPRGWVKGTGEVSTRVEPLPVVVEEVMVEIDVVDDDDDDNNDDDADEDDEYMDDEDVLPPSEAVDEGGPRSVTVMRVEELLCKL
eukprot:TRINITY_DN3912_c0_g1_i2.p1 TRINITY_DN3912_c0_g1~~TRINITY_DN3912_c0_g1_i2.p1  ORF type:complete len:157 (+),score=24.51 TRINITY_DN3912_c0_g1_i2:483-953(+)